VVGGALGAAYGVTGAAFAAAGGAALGQVAGAAVGRGSGDGRAGDGRAGDDDVDDALLDARWLGLWAGGGLLFLVTLRFMATRYWLPFLPAVLLSLPLRRDPRPWLAASLSLGALFLADASFQARGSERLAEEVAALGTGVFTGHWGWQWAMEAHGWRALDEGERAPPGALVAMPRQAWPQPVDVTCTDIVWEGDALPPLPWLPRAYSEAGRANLHANWIAGPPMTRTVAPWTFAGDPYEHVRVCAR